MDETHQKVIEYYRNRSKRSLFGENNFIITQNRPKMDKGIMIQYRDNNDNILRIRVYDDKTIAKEPVAFTNEELKFLDMNGYEVNEEHKRIFNQDTSDWWDKLWKLKH